MNKDKNLAVKNQIWSVLSGVANLALSIVVGVIATRMLGLEDGGIISFATGIAMILRQVVQFGTRNYIASDIKREFDFNVYLVLRIITLLVAVVLLAVIMVFSHSSQYKTLCTVFFTGIYFVDMFADVFMGEFQRNGKMYLSGQLRAAIAVVAMVVFFAGMLIWRDTLSALICAFFASLAVAILIIWHLRPEYQIATLHVYAASIKKLIFAAFPIFVGAFIISYLDNAQRFLLNIYASDEITGIYQIIVLPSSLIVLFNYFLLLGAELTRVSQLYHTGDRNRFLKRIHFQFLYVAGLTLACLTGAWLFGTRLLSWVYGVDVSAYRMEMLLMILGGGFLAMSTVTGTVLQIMRQQWSYLISLVVVLACATPVMWLLVMHIGINGAAWSRLIICLPLLVAQYLIVRKNLKKAGQAPAE